jgi:hypothetical protein
VGGTALFVGRDVLLRSLEKSVAEKRSFVLLGGPRMGRTSTLQQLAHRQQVIWRKPGANQATKLVPVVLDAAKLATSAAPQVAMALWDAITKAVCDPHVQSHAHPPRPPKPEFARQRDRVWEHFGEVATQLWLGFANTPGWCRYVLLLDNADALAVPALGPTVRALCALPSRDDAALPQAVGFAGGAPLRALAAGAKSPLKGLRTHALTVLRDAEVVTLLRALALESQGASAWIQASGKHPYILQRLLAAQAEAGPEGLEAALQTALPDLTAFFEGLWGSFPPPRPGRDNVSLEHELFAWLREQGSDATLADAEAALRLGPLKGAADFLEWSGITEKTMRGAGHVLRLASPLFVDWSLDQAG